MTLDARTEIFARIRAALRTSVASGPAYAAAIELSRLATADVASTESLAARFARELEAVGGETVIVSETGIDALARTVADRVARLGYHAIAVQGEIFAMHAASRIPATQLIDISGISVDRLEKADCAIIAAESLIADSGSAVVRLATYEERLLPYLPPVCIIVGQSAQLTARLDDAALLAGDDERGERVIITGPSRTADIEKTVVLGAHGPGSLTVIIAAV